MDDMQMMLWVVVLGGGDGLWEMGYDTTSTRIVWIAAAAGTTIQS